MEATGWRSEYLCLRDDLLAGLEKMRHLSEVQVQIDSWKHPPQKQEDISILKNCTARHQLKICPCVWDACQNSDMWSAYKIQICFHACMKQALHSAADACCEYDERRQSVSKKLTEQAQGLPWDGPWLCFRALKSQKGLDVYRTAESAPCSSKSTGSGKLSLLSPRMRRAVRV